MYLIFCRTPSERRADKELDDYLKQVHEFRNPTDKNSKGKSIK